MLTSCTARCDCCNKSVTCIDPEVYGLPDDWRRLDGYDFCSPACEKVGPVQKRKKK